MHCPRCHSPMMIVERADQPRSVQTWYQCTICGGQRLISVEIARYTLGGGSPLTSVLRMPEAGDDGL